MAIENDFQFIESATKKHFYVGAPLSLLRLKENQNVLESKILGLTKEEHYNWMVARGAKEIAKNTQTGFVVFAFEDKKKARKTMRELTKAYLRFRMQGNILNY